MRISCFFHFLKFFSDFHFIVLHNFVLGQVLTVREVGNSVNRHHNKEGISAAPLAYRKNELQVPGLEALVSKICPQPVKM
jgi:hypothetical protein